MDFQDKPNFRKKVEEVFNIACRTAMDDDVDAYFRHLQDYPLNIVRMAMNKAVQDRDPNDLYLRTLPITVHEIRPAAEEIFAKESESSVLGCEKCEGNIGLIVEKRADDTLIARRCECLLALIASKKKKRRGRKA